MNRRFFLTGLSTIGLSSCQLSSPVFNINLLANSIPSKLIKEFEKQYQIKLKTTSQKIYPDVIKYLIEPKAPSAISKFLGINPQGSPDLISIGDAWLADLLPYLQIIDPSLISNFDRVPFKWRSVIESKDKKIYGIPYRWGSTVIVYNKDKLNKAGIPPIESWKDLWNPKLASRISLPDSYREVIGLCLKSMNYSYNETNLSAISGLSNSLNTLNKQTLVYTSTQYIQALVNEDTWAAVGWSGDFKEILKRFPQLVMVYPQEGSALWFDLWTFFKELTNLDLAYKWIDYCLSPESTNLISLLTNGQGIGTLPDKATERNWLDACEPIINLSQSEEYQYQKVWTELRTRN